MKPADTGTAQNATRPTAHRAPPITLPSDPVESASLVLRYVQTATTAFDRSAAIEAMTARIKKLIDISASIETTVAELAGHAALLDALFQRWTAEAMAAKAPEHRMKFMKLAYQAQANYTRTLIAIEGLKSQKQGKALLTLNDEDLSSDDDN